MASYPRTSLNKIQCILFSIGNTSDGKFVQSSLLSGNVSAVVLDTYTAGTLKDYLVHPQIFMEETKMVTASYSVALGGETKRIRKCIRRFASENAKSILEKVDQLTFLYQVVSLHVCWALLESQVNYSFLLRAS